MNLLANKTAIVTGAGQGIGRAVAKGLAEQGASVVIAELNGENSDRVAKDIEAAGGTALAVQTDVSKEESVEDMVEKAQRAFKEVHILVNNAALFPASSVAEMKISEWEQVIRTNLTGSFFALVPSCRA